MVLTTLVWDLKKMKKYSNKILKELIVEKILTARAFFSETTVVNTFPMALRVRTQTWEESILSDKASNSTHSNPSNVGPYAAKGRNPGFIGPEIQHWTSKATTRSTFVMKSEGNGRDPSGFPTFSEMGKRKRWDAGT